MGQYHNPSLCRKSGETIGNIDQIVDSFTLDNGLRVFVSPQRHLHRTCINLCFNAGSRDESKSGTAHMLEHLIFRGTKRYPTLRELTEAFEDIGADFNAYTSRENTGYEIIMPPCGFERASELLCHALLEAKLTGIAAEREIIREEISADYDENFKLINADDLLLAEIFDDRFAHPIAGNPEDLNKLSKDDVLRFYKTHYFADNATLTISGCIEAYDPSERLAFKALIEQYYGKLPSGYDGNGAIQRCDPLRSGDNRLLIRKYTSSTQSEVLFGVLCPPVTDPHFVPHDIAVRILDDGFSGRLTRVLVDEMALVYDAESYISTLKEYSILHVRLTCRHRRVLRIIEVLHDILRELSQDGPTESELRRVRKRIFWEHSALLDAPAALSHWMYNMSASGLRADLNRRCDDLIAVEGAEVQEAVRRIVGQSPKIFVVVGDISREQSEKIRMTLEKSFAAPFVPSYLEE